jgi:hypothetical protein
MSEMPTTIAFLNVDLDIESREPIDLITKELTESDCIALWEGKRKNLFAASYEVNSQASGPESIINAFCLLIRNLTKPARDQWERCIKRSFDLGFDSGEGKQCYQVFLDNETIQEVASLGGTIAISIYPIYRETKLTPQVDRPK